jgi:ribonuclease D
MPAFLYPDGNSVNKLNSEYLYIEKQEQLNTYCQLAKQADVLALDTEFVRTRTLRSHLGLIQVFDGREVALIDPLCGLDLEPFWQLLSDPSIVKVLHSCHEDLEVFKYYANRLPMPLFDSQIAGQFLFQGKVLGFGAMVSQELGIDLDKGEARTNWLKRPLSDSQMHYAMNDVKYLLPLYHKLNEQLQDAGLQQYNLDEAKLKVTQKSVDKNTDRLYLDFGNAWQLSSRELAILQELATWRLSVAQEKDSALGFVVKDATLFSIAQRKPTDLNSLRSIPDINPHEVRIHGKALLVHVAKGKQIPDDLCPVKVPRLTDYPTYKQSFKALKQAVTVRSVELGVPMELLATKKQLNQWIKWVWKVAYAEPSDFELSWRYELLEPVLLKWNDEFSLETN